MAGSPRGRGAVVWMTLGAALVLNLLLTVVLALTVPLPEGEAMTPARSRSFLDAELRPLLASGQTIDLAEGTVSHQFLERRVFARGILADSSRTVVATQVLKIGWPFTTLRGFVHVAGDDIVTDGAARLRGNARTGFLRFVPFNPVWPGVIINTLGLALLIGLVVRLFHAKEARP